MSIEYAISVEAGKFYRACVEEPETVWRPVLAWTTEAGRPIRYVFTGDNYDCEAEALAKAEVLRCAWQARDAKRQLIIRVDGEIEDDELDDLKAAGAPSLTQWHVNREYDEMSQRGGTW
jgi:hypothetical protein